MRVDSNGVGLNVVTQGDGDVALVFLHFWGGSAGTWCEVVSRLQDRFRCVAIDARGAGESAAPAQGYRIEDHARDVLTVVRTLKLASYVLVGHSMGGKVAQFVAFTQPPGLCGLVLVASSPLAPMKIADAQREAMRGAYQDRASVEWTLDNVLVGSAIPDESRERAIADALRLSRPAKSGWIDVASREDLGAVARRLDIPVAILAGALDRVDPVEVVRAHIVPLYPLATLQILPGKGHLLPLEAPADIAAAIGAVVPAQ